jgi:hypothetical protein
MDATNVGNLGEQWVNKVATHVTTFNPQEEKEMYKQVQKELLQEDGATTMSSVPPLVDMPPMYD